MTTQIFEVPALEMAVGRKEDILVSILYLIPKHVLYEHVSRAPNIALLEPEELIAKEFLVVSRNVHQDLAPLVL